MSDIIKCRIERDFVMTKIKLSLPSGSEVEKPVITYFSNGGNYLILDGESVGSMGLPIILVSKINGDKAEKIIDQNEWQQVKGYLKSIISGGTTTYLNTPESIAADETYYTQLTLPVASFDALKNSYVVPTDSNVAPAAEPIAAATDAVSTTPEVVSPNETNSGSVETAEPVVPLASETPAAEPVVENGTNSNAPVIPDVTEQSSADAMQPVK